MKDPNEEQEFENHLKEYHGHLVKMFQVIMDSKETDPEFEEYRSIMTVLFRLFYEGKQDDLYKVLRRDFQSYFHPLPPLFDENEN